MKVAVVGWYNNNNCGDEAYKVAFPLLFPQHQFTFFDSPKKVMRKDFDCIVLGGGDIVKGSFTKVFDIGLPVYCMSVTITSGSDLDILHKFEKVVVRDQMSLDIAKNYCDATYLPDFTFGLTPNRDRGKILLESLFKDSDRALLSGQKLIGIVVNSHMAHNFDGAKHRDSLNFDNFVHNLSKKIENSPHNFLFIPFCTGLPEDDRVTNGWVAGRCKKNYKRILSINERLSVLDTLDIMSNLDFCISTRFHSTIFSIISEIPFIDIWHHDKNYGLIKTGNLEDYSTFYWNMDFNKLNNYIDSPPNPDKIVQFHQQSKRLLSNASPSLL